MVSLWPLKGKVSQPPLGKRCLCACVCVSFFQTPIKLERMALEAVVFPQGLLSCSSKKLYSSNGDGSGLGGWKVYDFSGLEVEEEKGLVLEDGMNGEGGDHVNFNISCSSSMLHNHQGCNVNSSSFLETGEAFGAREVEPSIEVAPRRKRRRIKSFKNKEEVESQRMTHIAVERNRRKLMNEHLAVLRSLMPASYAQRGDQASIVAGAINFVKELEQLLQTLEAQMHIKNHLNSTIQSSPFASFFTFPQYSSFYSETNKKGNNNGPDVAADIEVTMIESHVNLKVCVRRQPKQLLRLVMGLQSFLLTTLHLNVTTAADQMVLYSFSLKVEDECQFMSVDEIAAAVYQIVGMIQNENFCS